MTDRFQPPSGLADQAAQRALGDVSRVFDSQPRLNFKPETATALSVAPGEIRRLAPRSGGQTVVLPAAAPSNAGQSVALFVSGLGTLTVTPVTGTINGASALTFAAGTYSLALFSDGTTWLTPGLSTTTIDALAGAGLSRSGTALAVNGSTSIVVTGDQVTRAALTGDVTAGANTNATTLSDSVIVPSKLVASLTFGVPFFITQALTGGVAGSADDVTIYNANAPFAFRILDCWLIFSVGVVGSTVQLRDTAGGGGGVLSSALASVTPGTSRNNDTSTRAVAANGSVFVRRSDRSVAGRIIIAALRE